MVKLYWIADMEEQLKTRLPIYILMAITSILGAPSPT